MKSPKNEDHILKSQWHYLNILKNDLSISENSLHRAKFTEFTRKVGQQCTNVFKKICKKK